jgi:phage terminase small subunit
MPRKSAAALATKVDGKSTRLAPYPGVTPEVRALWLELTAACAPDHFRASDRPLLEQYCQSVSLAREAYGHLREEGPVVNGRHNPWLIFFEKANRACVALSARLRLSPQHRTDPKTVGRAKASLSYYERMELEE